MTTTTNMRRNILRLPRPVATDRAVGMTWLVLCLLCMTVFHDNNAALFASASASSSTSTSSSENIRSLDSYGEAVQLNHAQYAATKQGRTILALIQPASPSSYMIVYGFTDPPKYQRRSSVQPASSPSIIHRIAHHHAIVCSGLQGDALSLVDDLQNYVVKVWERYGGDDDDSSSSSAFVFGNLAIPIAQFYQRFWGASYSNKNLLWQGSCWDDEDDIWARPMGLQTLVLSYPTNTNNNNQLQLIQPSGTIVSMNNICWMGQHSESLQRNRLLQEQLQDLLVNTNSDATAGSSLQQQRQQQLLQILQQHQVFGASCRAIVIETYNAEQDTIDKTILSLP